MYVEGYFYRGHTLRVKSKYFLDDFLIEVKGSKGLIFPFEIWVVFLGQLDERNFRSLAEFFAFWFIKNCPILRKKCKNLIDLFETFERINELLQDFYLGSIQFYNSKNKITIKLFANKENSKISIKFLRMIVIGILKYLDFSVKEKRRELIFKLDEKS